MLESYPQWILNMFIIVGLKIDNLLNFASTAISAISLIYGLGNFLAFEASNENPEYPFSKTVWGMLTILVDSMLRGFSLAYIMKIVKQYVLFIPFIYFFMMLLTIMIVKRKKWPSSYDVIGTIFSFVCSAYEDKKAGHTFRVFSKCVFGTIFIVISVSLGINKSTTLFQDHSEIYSEFDPSACSNICPNISQTEAEKSKWMDKIGYCHEIWKTYPPEFHIPVWIVIGVLFLLSIIEGILEKYHKWMPYQKLYGGTDFDPKHLNDIPVQQLPKKTLYSIF